jgi:hypothetical protein
MHDNTRTNLAGLGERVQFATLHRHTATMIPHRAHIAHPEHIVPRPDGRIQVLQAQRG